MNAQAMGCYTPPVSRLSDDVLLGIFLESVSPLDRMSKWSLKEEALTFRRIMRVNRTWSLVGRSSPSLWGRTLEPDRAKLSWFKETLSRSKSAPLYIVSSGKVPEEGCGCPQTEEIWRLLSAHFDRCVYFYAVIPYSRKDLIYPLLWLPAPSLKTCTIISCLQHFATVLPGGHSIFRIEPEVENGAELEEKSLHLFNNHAPLLHTLRLINCQYNAPDGAVFPSLKDTRILSFSLPPLQWLTNHRTLLTLVITSLPPWMDATSIPILDFPFLETLHICTGILLSPLLLQKFKLPDTCSIHAHMSFPTSVALPGLVVPTAWLCLLSHYKSSIFTSLRIRAEDEKLLLRLETLSSRILEVIVDARDSQLNASDMGLRTMPTDLPEVYSSPSHVSSFLTWFTIIKSAPHLLVSIRSLVIEVLDRLIPLHLLFLASHLQNVQVLRLLHVAPAHPVWYHSLFMERCISPEVPPNSLLFPNLQQLVVPNVVQGSGMVESIVDTFVLQRNELSQDHTVDVSYYEPQADTEFQLLQFFND